VKKSSKKISKPKKDSQKKLEDIIGRLAKIKQKSDKASVVGGTNEIDIAPKLGFKKKVQ